MDQVAIRVTEVARRFGRAVAVAGASLEVRRGEVVGLLGPNGAGKTTTLAMLMGQVRPDTGTIRVLGRLPDDLATRARVGHAPDGLTGFGSLTARELLELLAGLQGLRGSRRRASVAEVTALLDLEAASRRRIRALSRGTVQRLLLAQALLGEPDVLVLDEPGTGLDPLGMALLRDVLRKHAAMGSAVLVSSHQLAEVGRCCDRVVLMARGRTVRHAVVAELGDIEAAFMEAIA